MTQLALLFIGTLATLATYGLFYQFGDRWTNLLIEFGASALWGLFAVSAMDVIVREAAFTTESEPIWPLVFLGLGMSVLALLYAIYDLAVRVSEEATETDIGGLGR